MLSYQNTDRRAGLLEEVALEDMLNARERRAAIQKSLLDEFGAPLVCLTLNIPGPVKVLEGVPEAFERGCRRIKADLQSAGFPVLRCMELREKTGYELFLSVEGEAMAIKTSMAAIEDDGRLGRLYDIDVIRPDGCKVSREEFGLPPRTCLLCGQPAHACSRSRRHSVAQLVEEIHRILAVCFPSPCAYSASCPHQVRGCEASRSAHTGGGPMNEKSSCEHSRPEDPRLERFLDCVEQAAAYGLLEEVRTTPKPGLVDLRDNGSHRDMCYDTFVASTEAVVPYLVEMARLGFCLDGPEDRLFPAIRPVGVKAEAAMFAATGGVNTHKGIIFSLGIIAACLGYDYRRTGSLDPIRVLELGGLATRSWLEEDFDRMKTRPPKTHGEHLFAEYGYRGIRGEAQEGFPALRLFALPAMTKAMAVQPDANRARLYVLLTLMANVDDTNILIRSNPQTLEYAQEEARRLLLSHPVITDRAMEELATLNREFIARNISPGGCADLLAIAIFFERLGQLIQK